MLLKCELLPKKFFFCKNKAKLKNADNIFWSGMVKEKTSNLWGWGVILWYGGCLLFTYLAHPCSFTDHMKTIDNITFEKNSISDWVVVIGAWIKFAKFQNYQRQFTNSSFD